MTSKQRKLLLKKKSRCQERITPSLYGKITVHAEVAAMLGLPKSILRRATVVVVRVNSDGSFRISKPCTNCEKRLRAMGVPRIYYSTTSPEHEMLGGCKMQ